MLDFLDVFVDSLFSGIFVGTGYVLGIRCYIFLFLFWGSR